MGGPPPPPRSTPVPLIGWAQQAHAVGLGAGCVVAAVSEVRAVRGLAHTER